MSELGEIPIEWQIKSINDICYVNPDTLSNKSDDSLSLEYIDIESVTTRRINEIKKLEFKDAPSRARRLIKRNDVIMSTVRPYLKAFAKINIEKDNLVCSTGFAVLRAKKNINHEFLFQSILSDYYIQQLSNKMVGSNYPAVNSSDVRESNIILPPLEEQEKIASILSTVDEQIDNVDALIEKNKELKKGLMQTLLTKGIGHTKFKKTEIGEIPEEWQVKRLGNVCEVKSSKRVYQSDYIDSGVPFYRSKEIIELSKGNLPTVELFIARDKFEEFKEKYGVPKLGDLMITSVGSVGKTWVCDGREFYYKDGNLTQIISNNEINTKYISYVFECEYLIKQYLGQSSGSAQVALTLEKLKNLLVIFPTIKEQEKIASILSEVDKKIEEYENKKQKLEELKKGLMQQLLTGMIRVTV